MILPTGKFSVQVVDLQAKFDVNQLAGASVVTLEFGRRLMRALDLPPETADQIARILGVTQGVEKLDDLGDFGVSSEALSALAPYVGALPVSGTINLNTVDPFLLAVMLQNRGQAAQLIRLRTGRGLKRVSCGGAGTGRNGTDQDGNRCRPDEPARGKSRGHHRAKICLRQACFYR